MAVNAPNLSELEDENTVGPPNSIRWLLSGLVFICFAGRSFVATGFAVTTQAVADYFGRNVAEIEALRSYELFVATLVALILALQRNVKLRNLFIATAGFLFLATAFAAVGFMNRKSYWLTVISFTASGISSGIIFLLPTLLADAWLFPTYNPLIFGLSYAFMYVGAAGSELAFSSMGNITIDKTTTKEEYNLQSAFVGGIGAVCLLTFASTVLICVCMVNRDGMPSDDGFEHLSVEEAPEGIFVCFSRSAVKRVSRSLSNIPFTLAILSNFFGSSLQAYCLFLMPEFLMWNYPEVSSTTSTAVYVSSMLAGIIGCCIAIFVLLRFRNPAIVSLGGAIGVLITCVAVYLSFVFQVFISVVFFQIAMVIFGALFMVGILELMLSFRGDIDKVTALALHFAFYNFGLFVFDLLEKVLVYHRGGDRSLLVILISGFAAPCFLLCASVSDRRRSATREASQAEMPRTEETHLISGDFSDQ